MNLSADNQLTGAVIGAAIDVHRQLGPELDEAAYEEALCRRLTRLGTAHRRQVALPLSYKGVRLDCGYRLDVLVEDRLPLELKSVSELLGVHDAQLLTYLRIGGYPLGLLMNFNVEVLKHGIKRRIETRKWEVRELGKEEFRGAARFGAVSAEIVMAAMEVHRHIGPGLLAGTYEECLCHELAARHLGFKRRKAIPLFFDGEPLSKSAEVPLVVADELPVFPVCADAVTPIETAAALARLRQGGWRQGLILNFNEATMVKGMHRVVL